MRRSWDHKPDFCPLSGGAVDGKLAADLFEPLAHIVQSIAAFETGRRGVGVSGWIPVFEAGAIVPDGEGERLRLRGERDQNFGGGGMFHDVVQRFFERQKQIVPHFSCKRPGR